MPESENKNSISNREYLARLLDVLAVTCGSYTLIKFLTGHPHIPIPIEISAMGTQLFWIIKVNLRGKLY